ncbi:MAG: hypothetical protein GXX99_06300 [Clostridiales bacterium]|nr:hypothetical protein [Clostridiales bacterium]
MNSDLLIHRLDRQFPGLGFAEWRAGPYHALWEARAQRIGLVPFGVDGAIHGRAHTRRVLLLSAFLAARRSLAPEMADRLFMACVYHDTGRQDDQVDPTHGECSCAVYRRENPPDEVVEALIRWHCITDKVAMEQIGRLPQGAVTAFRMLKDADALDRQRFGDLRAEMLRLPDSRLLIPVAKYLVDFMR